MRTTFYLLIHLCQSKVASVYQLETEEEQQEAHRRLCARYGVDPECSHDGEDEFVMVDTIGYFSPDEVMGEHTGDS